MAQLGYAYDSRGEDTSQRVDSLLEVCERHGVPLAAAALQWSTRDLRIDSTVVGISGPERVDETLALLTTPLPVELWEELAPLTSPREQWLW